MIQTLDITVKETDVVRVLALNLGPDEAEALIDDAAGLAPLLGVPELNTDFLEVFRLADLEGLGLAQYLQDGYGVPAEAVGSDAARLSALSGYGVVLLSSAMTHRPITLTFEPAVTLIAQYGLTGTDWQADADTPPESAKPYSGADTPRKTPSDAAMSGRIATLALLVLALIVILMIWIA